MTVSVHNPDQYMASLRQIIAQGRKRIGLLVGAGAPAGSRIFAAATNPGCGWTARKNYQSVSLQNKRGDAA